MRPGPHVCYRPRNKDVKFKELFLQRTGQPIPCGGEEGKFVQKVLEEGSELGGALSPSVLGVVWGEALCGHICVRAWQMSVKGQRGNTLSFVGHRISRRGYRIQLCCVARK